MDKNEAYAILSDLVFKGFLTAELNIDGQVLILKTVNEKEFDLMKIYAGNPKAANYQARFNIYFLIFSLLVLNNENVLCKRTEKIAELYDYFLKIPDKLFRKMVENLNQLRLSAYESLKYIEGFSYTTIARNTWRALNNNLPSCTEFTGIPGTSEMGINVHQESWIVINRSMDFEEEYNKEFSMALLIASSTNSKGARHVRNQHDSAKNLALDRRKKLAKEGCIDTRKWTPEGWAAPVDTAEELVAELERQMTGQKDKHDLFMEKYMNSLKEQARKKTQEAEERIKRSQEGRDNVLIDGSQRQLTQEETKKLNLKQSTYIDVPEEIVSEEDKNKFYKKIGARVLTGK